MRLLNTQTLQLEFFVSEEKPEYAILSHTWGSEEVLFENVRNGKGSLLECGKSGLEKVLKSAELAAQNDYQYIWIDACCIDKSSSAELSEAINSMFDWYQRSAVCYAFLSDYQARDSELSEARWFVRGWTLQELIAPPEVHFYDSAWTRFGDRCSLSSKITAITGIDERLLRKQFSCFHHEGTLGGPERGCRHCSIEDVALTRRLLGSYSISTRMSWAARRKTTRVEDIAYCLLGIFDVAMPLLYGEGLKAFRRLQEEIVRHSSDQTFLTWRYYPREGHRYSAVFAAHPDNFEGGDRIRAVPPLLPEFAETTVRNGGAVELEIHLAPCTVYLRSFERPYPRKFPDAYLAVLDCSEVTDEFCRLSILLKETNTAPPRSAAPRSFRRLRHAVDACFPPLLFSPTADGNARTFGDWNDTAPFRIEPELSKMTRCRILLHEIQEEWPARNIIDRRAYFTIKGGLKSGYYVRRQVPDPTSSTWENGLPYRLLGPIGSGVWLYIYGAASISSGKCEFTVIWGTFKENDTPFCEVVQKFGWTALKEYSLATALGVWDDGFDIRTLEAFSSLAWVTGDASIRVEATIKGNEFFGRKRFDVEVTIKEVGCDHDMCHGAIPCKRQAVL
ncbi:hypothetical protein MAPG_00803 [Magnaporthiopsis poae ATCC 64411]|uniref:Uncharacterized protein n=1 Tax=Magnaporthiopsis poae (strain ATCC 64411 / 73-15) TaxID=644358 RepID=A0A0C4DM01_MAGP6|nr:hypothetical protein MAPG_00803 [Magnaporthiopsis poae ATCC 64411]